jgi:hypothetical protein
MDKKEILSGENANIRIWVYDEYFKPVSDADIRLQLVSPDGKKQSVEAHEETSGVYAVALTPDQLGTYEIAAWASRHGRSVGEEKMRFQVVEGFSEEEDLRPDFDLLRELATVSSGRFFRSDEFSAKLLKEFSDELERKGGQKVLLWNSPWLFSLIVLLLGVEWYMRKKRGLP